jgi:hypothetical protein
LRGSLYLMASNFTEPPSPALKRPSNSRNTNQKFGKYPISREAFPISSRCFPNYFWAKKTLLVPVLQRFSAFVSARRVNLRHFPNIFPISNANGFGDWFATHCMHHHAVVRNGENGDGAQKAAQRGLF